MKWMEFIKVQSAASVIEQELQGFIDECREHHGFMEAKVFRHASVDDCSLCLRWDTDAPEAQGSRVGMHLSRILRRYGLVDHSVWIEGRELEEEKA